MKPIATVFAFLVSLLTLGAVSAVQTPTPRYPEATLSNDQIRVRVYLPDPERGFYRSTRFDWSGVIASLEFQGHQYYGPWFTGTDPTVRDFIYKSDTELIASPQSAITGPAEEFSRPQGFAEANPAMDVSGRDSAQKLAILASLAFNVKVDEADIHLEGIDKLDAADLKFAEELGYVVKLLAIAGRAKISGDAKEHQADPVSLRVHPTLVHKSDLLAQVSGSFNAISFFGHALGHALFYGRGAGRMPTASAVVSDIIGVALGTTPAQFRALNVFVDQTPRANVLPFDQLESRYYLRLTAKDQPGVLAAVTKVLGDNKISLASFLQHEVNGGDAVPLVLTTHLAREGAIQTALKQINALPTITAPCVCLRIIDQPKEFAQA